MADGPLVRSLWDDFDRLGDVRPALCLPEIADHEQRFVVGRGNAGFWLASDQSEWMTGQNLVVAGGLAGVGAAPPNQVVRDWSAREVQR